MNEMNFNPARIIALWTAVSVVSFSAESFALNFSASSVKLQRKVKNVRELRDQNVVRQTSDYSCGAAGLSTILSYDQNDPIGERDIMLEILKSVDIQKVQERQGFSLLDLKKFSEARGYKVTGLKMDLEHLRQMDKVVLVPIKFKNYRHFVIVKGIIGDRVFVADPAMGNMIMGTRWFKRIWQDGIGLIIEDPAAANGSKSRKPSRLRLKKEDFIYVDGQKTKPAAETGWILPRMNPVEF